MPKTKISEFSATPGNNTDIDGINIAEGCAPSGINDAIRELMAQLKDFQAGTAGDSFNGPVGTSTAAAGAFTTLSATGVATFSSGTAGAPAITTTGDTNTGIFFPAADTVAASVGGTEGLRLTSTGLGVGTSSPATKLDIVGGGAAGQLSLSTNLTDATTKEAKIVVRHYTNAEENFMVLYPYSTATANEIYYGGGSSSQNAATAHVWVTAANNTTTSGTERLRLDSSGNLGLGVTPFANSIGKSLDMSGGAGLFGYSNRAYLSGNAYFDGGWKYKATANACLYGVNDGNNHAWYTAASGTAGNAISFTQAMTLDSSGRLLVGTTTAADSNAMLNVYNPNATSAQIVLQNTTTGVGSNGSRLLATGNDLYITNKENGFMAFETNDTERARITSGGDLLVNRTSTLGTAKFVVEADTTTANPMTVSNSRSTTATDYSILFYRNASLVGSVQTSLTATSYVTSSDYRLKENIQPMTGALAKVAALKPVTYKWKATGGEADGFIAHELAEVCPQAVTGDKDAMDEEGKPVYQGIDTSFLVATLAAALQEAHGLIKNLQTRVDALEAK